MIFVTVGTHTQGFERLIKAVDELVGSGKIKEKVIMQIGNTKYEPKNCEWFRFESFEKIKKRNMDARAIITHAGEGSIIVGLKLKKPLIIVPRYKKFGEHVDDHQLDLADALHREKMCAVVYEISELYPAIKGINPKSGGSARKEKLLLISNFKKYLNHISAGSARDFSPRV